MKKANTLIISPYPRGGNDQNTGPRYAEEAAITGFEIHGMKREGADTLHFSPRLRRRLSSPALFDEMCSEAAEQLRPRTEYYDTVIVRGQSTGGFQALGMVKSDQMHVTHLLLEDGINTRTRRNGSPLGGLAARHDWLSYSREEKYRFPKVERPADWIAPPKIERNILQAVAVGAKIMVESTHYSPLWRSSYSTASAVEVIKTQPEIAMLFKFLGHTGTSDQRSLEIYTKELRAAEAARFAEPDRPAAPVVIDYDPDGWHAYLVFPQYGAANLQQVAQLKSYVTT